MLMIFCKNIQISHMATTLFWIKSNLIKHGVSVVWYLWNLHNNDVMDD